MWPRSQAVEEREKAAEAWMILRRENVFLFCELWNMWMFEGCWAAPHRLTSPVLAQPQDWRKSPESPSKTSVISWMGDFTHPSISQEGCHQHSAPQTSKSRRDSPSSRGLDDPQKRKRFFILWALKYVDVWGLLGCTPQAYKPCTCPASRLKKEPRVTVKDISDFMDGGFYTSQYLSRGMSSTLSSPNQ